MLTSFETAHLPFESCMAVQIRVYLLMPKQITRAKRVQNESTHLYSSHGDWETYMALDGMFNVCQDVRLIEKREDTVLMLATCILNRHEVVVTGKSTARIFAKPNINTTANQ